MEKLYSSLFVLALTATMVLGQNPVTIGTPEDINLFINSGQNFLLIPDVNDNDEGVDQAVTFTVTSDDPAVVSIDSVSFTPGQTFATVHLTEHGILDSVTVSIEANYGDGTASTSVKAHVVTYSNPGVHFEIHDVVFWQQVVPLDANPAFSMIAEDGVAPYEDIDLPSLNLSVYSDCETSPPCTGTDFFTASLSIWICY